MEVGALTVQIAADTSSLKRGVEEAQYSMQQLGGIMDRNIDSIASSFSRLWGGGSVYSATRGGGVLAQLIGSLQNSMLQDFFQDLKTQAFGTGSGGLGYSMSRLFGNLGGLGLGSLLTSAISGRAAGGAVGAGQSFMVGESGPELFTPFTSGWVTANNKMNGVNNQPISLNMTIMTPDAGSFRSSQGQVMAEAALALQKARRYM